MANEYDSLLGDTEILETDNEYDSLLTENDSAVSSGLKSSMRVATKKNADAQSNIINLSEKSGLPADTVERNPAEVENKLRFEENDYDELIKTNPVLSKNLADPAFASIAHDDIENLSFWELTKNSIKNVPSSLFAAAETTSDIARAVPAGLLHSLGAGIRGLSDINDAIGRSILSGIGATSPEAEEALNVVNDMLPKGFSVSEPFRQSGAAYVGLGEEIGPDPERQNLATDIAGGVGQITGQIAVSLVNPAVGLSFLFGQGADQQSQRATDEGATVEKRDQAILMGSAVTGITEKIGLDNLLDRIPPKIKNNILKQLTDISIAGGLEAAQEVVEGIFQNLIAIGVYDSEGSLVEGLEREALAAGGAGAIFRAIINAATPGRMSGTERKHEQQKSSVTNKDVLDNIGASSKESKLRERSPEKYQKLVAESLENSGVENVGIPAENLQTFFQENPDSYADFADNIEGFEESFANASALGEDVQIPTDVLAAHIASKEYYDALSQDIRLTTDAMTAREAESFNEEAATQLQADYEKYADQIVSDTEGVVSGDKVFDDVKEQLIAAGQTEDIAGKNAAIHKAFFETMAERTGVDAFDLYQGQNIKIRSEQQRNKFDETIDALRKGAAPTETQALGPTLTEFLRESGGVRDAGGELASRDIDKDKAAFTRNLIQEEGLEIDDAITAAVEAGYIPEPDPDAPTDFGVNELLEMIDAEQGGQPVYSEQNIDRDLDATRTEINALEELLGQAGLDITTMTNIEVKDFLNNIVGQEFDQDQIKSLQEAATLGIETEEITDAREIEKILEEYAASQVRLGGLPADDDAYKTVSGGQAQVGWREATSIVRNGKPAIVHRGARGNLTVEKFSQENLGKATGHPTSGLGVFLSSDYGQAAGYGSVVESVHVDIRNPKIYTTDTMPEFTSIEEAFKHREALRVRGYDGIVIDLRDVGAPVNYVVFDAEQVIHPPKAEDVGQEFFQEGITPESVVEDFSNSLQEKHPELETIFLNVSGTDLKLGSLIIKKGDRKKGAGSNVMNDITDFADANGLRVLLTPGQKDDIQGTTSRARLVKFYKRFGFKENKGRNKDFEISESMFREPDITELTGQGDVDLIETGKPVSFHFIHNTESATEIFGKPKKGAPFGREFEPSARFVNIASKKTSDKASGQFIGGKLTFRNPLVVPNDDLKWKETLSKKYDGKTGKALSKALIADGYDGVITTEENHISETVDLTTFDEAKALFQDDVSRGTKRGRIIFTDDTTIIDLFKDANLSTFLHESGHLFLNAFSGIASQPDAPQQIQDDMSAILSWLEVDSIEALNPANNGEAAVAAQEKWARGIESYLREGKSPSAALQSAFQRFKSWLLNVYKSAKNLNVELTDEIREVMDRMLATEVEIRNAQERNNIKSVFEADETLTAEQAAEINQVNAEAIETAKEKLLAKLLREISREKKKWWKDEKSVIRKEVEDEYNQRQDFKTKHWLQHGVLPDGTDLGIDSLKLSRADLISMYGDNADSLWRKLPFGKNSVWTSDGGVHPDVVAEAFGYTSGDQMVKSIIDAGNMKTAVNEEAQKRMLERHGDILNDGSIEAEADEAMHNISSAKAMLNDINELNKRTNRKPSPAQIYKSIAKEITGNKKVKDLQPGRILQNERRITDRLLKAIEAGDDEAALKLANQRLMNHHLYMAARDAKLKSDTIQRRMKKFDKKAAQQRIGKAGGDYLDQILHLLDLVEFRKSVSIGKQERAKSYSLWIKEQEEADAPVIPNEQLMKLADKKHWRTMTYNELIGFNDTILNIEHIASVKNKLIVGKEKRDLNEVADGVINNITENIELKETIFNTRTKKEGRKRTISQFLGTLIKAQTRIEVMDGGSKIGKSYDALKKHIDDGEIKRFGRIQEESEKFFDIVSRFYSTGIKLGEKEITNTFEKLSSSNTAVYISEIDASLTKEERLMVALNLGTEKNRQRFVDGRSMNDAQIDAILATLDENDANFIQAIWDFNNSFWPEIAELEQKRTGIKPEQQEAVPITVAGVNLRGGYIPIKFDAAKDVKALQIDEEQTFKDMRSGRNSRAQTRRGFTKARVEGKVTIAVRVDFGVLQEHMNEVITDITMGEAIDAAYKVLHHNGVKTAIQNHMGSDIFQELDMWLEDTAVGSVKAAAGMSQVFKGLRASVTVGAMGWKVATSLIQVSGFSQSFVEVGYKPMAKGITKFILSVGNKSLIDSVFEKSAFMRERATTFQRDIRDALIRLEGDGLINNFQKTLFWPIIKMQQMVDIPTWMGAYEKGIEVGNERGLTEDALDSFAVNYADQAVENSQGTGMFKGLSAIERGTLDKQTRTTEIVKLWTTFYSYFNTKLNIAYRQTKGTNFKSPQEVAVLASDYLMLFWIEALIGEAMLGRMPDFEDDEESALWYNIKLILATFAGTVPVLREMSSVLQGFGAAPGGVRGIETLGRGVKTISSVTEDIAKGEDIDLLKVAQPLISAVNVISPVKYPAGQINVTLEAMRRSNEGEDVDPVDYLIRPSK